MGTSSSFVGGRGDSHQPDVLRASQLCGEFIGSLIRFRIPHDERETVVVVTGELRQLSIDGGQVMVILGVGADEEYVLDLLDFVILRPAEHYGDVEVLLGRDPEYAQYGKR